MTNPAWTTTAAAKLNLTLEVLGKRDDGFHDLASVAVSLDLADQVRLTRTIDGRSVTYLDESGRRVSIETSDDIVLKAWDALAKRVELPGGGEVEVTKRIPITSGLGGGSTDAAAFLRLARVAWNLPVTDQELCEVGAEVGSDVPVCLLGGLVRMSGRGERGEPLESSPSWSDGWAVLLHRPEIPVPAAKTATMYRSLRSSDYRDASVTGALVETLSSGQPITQDCCVNSFDRPAREVMQGLTAAWRRMGAAIARVANEPLTPLLAGAGPTLFAVLSVEDAHTAADELRGVNGFTTVARPLDRAAATDVRVV